MQVNPVGIGRWIQWVQVDPVDTAIDLRRVENIVGCLDFLIQYIQACLQERVNQSIRPPNLVDSS
jgi:hypothetical protein